MTSELKWGCSADLSIVWVLAWLQCLTHLVWRKGQESLSVPSEGSKTFLLLSISISTARALQSSNSFGIWRELRKQVFTPYVHCCLCERWSVNTAHFTFGNTLCKASLWCRVHRLVLLALSLSILSSQLVRSSRGCVLTLTQLPGSQLSALGIRQASEKYSYLQKRQCHPQQAPQSCKAFPASKGSIFCFSLRNSSWQPPLIISWFGEYEIFNGTMKRH